MTSQSIKSEILPTFMELFAESDRVAPFSSPYVVEGWQRGSNGRLSSCFKNAILGMQHLGVSSRRDEFSGHIMLGNAKAPILPDLYVGRLNDEAMSYIRKLILDKLHFDTSEKHLHAAVKALAEEDRFNPVTLWLDSLVWDGEKRLGSWLAGVCDADASPINGAIGQILILAMVTRAYYPGTKYDTCVIFEGSQGAGKSSLARALAAGPHDHDYFLDTPGLINMNAKERGELLSGKWVVELSELAGLGRSEIESTKAFISQDADNYRAAYAVTASVKRRTCVLVGTTNSAGYLQDVTGNRRFLPVKCGKIRLDQFELIRTQLFAEAVAYLKSKVKSYPTNCVIGHPLEFALAQQLLTLPENLRETAATIAAERLATSALEEAVNKAIDGLAVKAMLLPNGQKFLRSNDLLNHIKLDISNYGGAQLGTQMAAHGWDSLRITINNERLRGYAQRQASS